MIYIYCANITSLSDHAIKYLFKECKKSHIWSLLETRLESHRMNKYKNDFKSEARQLHATPADTSSSAESGGMAHAGELISPMSHLNITPIDPAVYKYIEAQTGAPLRICATYVRLKKLTFLFANAYFWDKVGPKHESNELIYMQLFLLQSIIGIAMFIYADFNCTPEEVIDSGWPCKLKMQILAPNGPTAKGSDRIIDFALIHECIFPCFSAFTFDHYPPWGPHYGLILSLCRKPLEISHYLPSLN